MRPEVAHRRIESFAKRFGAAHLYFAYHAAFPLALTPDLLYRLWANFQRDIHGRVLGIPWVAVADLLLSSLCDEVGHELYEMDVAVRNELLRRLKEDSNFGSGRISELSDFLLAYVRQQLQSNDPDVRDFAKAQKWTALAYARPNEAARELASVLSRAYHQDRAELVWIASLVETFAEPLAEFEPLLVYARGIGRFAGGDQEGAEALFSKLRRHKQQQEVAGVSSEISKKLKLMVVDDEPDNLDLVYRLLRRDFQVFKADSGVSALEILEREGEMAVIIADQRMPVMNGTEFLSKTVQLFPDTMHILLTGYTDVEDLVDAINSAHVFKYVTKPWNPENLKAVVQQAAEMYRILKKKSTKVAAYESSQLRGQEQHQEVGEVSSDKLEKLKLMVVDDEPGNLDLLYRTVRREYRVFKADSGVSALEILEREGEMAIIIADQRMPQMNGTEFFSWTLDQFPHTMRIILTGYTDVEDLVEAINSAHAFKYITKPWNPDSLRAVVQQAAEIYSMQKERGIS